VYTFNNARTIKWDLNNFVLENSTKMLLRHLIFLKIWYVKIYK